LDTQSKEVKSCGSALLDIVMISLAECKKVRKFTVLAGLRSCPWSQSLWPLRKLPLCIGSLVHAGLSEFRAGLSSLRSWFSSNSKYLYQIMMMTATDYFVHTLSQTLYSATSTYLIWILNCKFQRWQSLSSFCKWENWDSEKLSNFLRDIYPTYWNRIQTQAWMSTRHEYSVLSWDTSTDCAVLLFL
jgi:hypothetical protein